MPQVTKFALNAGELSDEMAGRPDIGKFQMGCEILENARVLRQGGATRRAGFLFGDLTLDQGRKSRMQGFGFSSEQGVAIEFSHLQISVFKNGQRIAGPYPAPWTEDQIFALDFSQRIDRLIVCHGDVPTQSIFRVNDTNWTISDFPWQVRVWESFSDASLTLTPSQQSGNGATIAASQNVFDSTWVGQRLQLIYIRDESVFRGEGPSTTNAGSGSRFGRGFFRNLYSPPAPMDPPTDALPPTIVKGSWEFETFDTWVGTFVLERSIDNGLTYTPVQQFTSTGTQNFKFEGFENEDGNNLIRVTYTGSNDADFSFSYGTEIVSGTPPSQNPPSTIVDPQLVQGSWSFETSGTWEGTFTIERSFNDGATYDVIKTLASNDDKNFILNESEAPDANALIRILYEGPGDAPYVFTVAPVDVPGQAIITAVTSSTQVTVNIERPFIDVTPTANWQEEAFSPRNGYAKTSTFFQKRLVFGGSKARPQNLYLSRTRRPFDFTQGTLADDGLNFELDSEGYESIIWVVSHLSLVVGTTSAIWAISTPDGRSITPENNASNKQVKKAAFEGIPGIHVDENVLFLQRKGRKIHELTGGSVEYGGYTSVDLTQLSTQVTRNGVKQVTSGEIPDSALYVINGDEISVLTYERPQNVVGWARWKTDGAFESVATCPGNGEDDDVYVVVNRNGVRSVEFLSPDMLRTEEDNDVRNLMFLDSAVVRQEAAPFSNMTGLAHLEGRTVQAFADGEVKGEFTVTGGEVDFGAQYTSAAVGLSFATLIRPMPLDFGQVGSKSAIYDLLLRVRNSRGGQVSQDGERFSRIDYELRRTSQEQPPDLISGDLQATPHSTWQRGTSITIRQDAPLPFTLLALRIKSRTN